MNVPNDITPKATDDGVPLCTATCKYFDGKRCEVLGFRPGAICEPGVVRLATNVKETNVNLTAEPAETTVKVIADSITDGGSRLITMEWTYPRVIHAEVLTHGSLRRNSASSRAIPAAKLRERVMTAPFIPVHWGANQKGMQADEEIADPAIALDWWLRARQEAAKHHAEGEALGLHKQVVNRLIEPWMMITIIITATDWANFFHLRKHKDAEPNFQKLATLAWEAFHDHTPEYVEVGNWHLPYIFPEDETSIDILKKVSTGRCARVSHLTHDGKRDLSLDVDLHDKLIGSFTSGGPGHFSPFEHPCMAVGGRQRIGPFEGWKSYRKFFANEAGPDTYDRCWRCGCWAGNHTRECPVRTS